MNAAEIVKLLHPKRVVELGTGDGAGAARMMGVLDLDAKLITINWPNPPSGDNPRRYLEVWQFDKRLTTLSGDTCDPNVVDQVPNNIDFLIIDSTHTKSWAMLEWTIYSPLLKDGAMVLVDDLDHNDMMDFWDILPFVKSVWTDGACFGTFQYRRGMK